MKPCKECGVEKPLTEFYKEGVGHRNKCKLCHNASSRKYNKENKDKIALNYQTNKDRKDAITKAYREKNSDKYNEKKREYERGNRPEINARQARRRALKRHATSSWADLIEVELIYAKCHRLSVWLDEKYEVDHIVPLVSDTVCGLHNQFNLTIETKLDNLSKGNRHWPDMWESYKE